MPLLRIPTADNADNFVLVHVDVLNQKGGLNAKLLATEGEAVYVHNLKHTQISRLKSSKSPLSDVDWSKLLTSVLLGTESSTETAELLQGLRVEAAVESEKGIDININKSLSGVTQRLGALHLIADDSQEIELFNWAGEAVSAFNDSQKQLLEQRQKTDGLKSKLETLQKHNEELIKAKEEAERVILEKCARLLNEKKGMIRQLVLEMREKGVTPKMQISDQAREDSGDEGVALPTRNKGKGNAKPAARAGKGKRKAPEPEPEAEDEDEEEGMFVKDDEERDEDAETTDAETEENDDVEDNEQSAAEEIVSNMKDTKMADDDESTASEGDDEL
jgi:hypothetical protein